MPYKIIPTAINFLIVLFFRKFFILKNPKDIVKSAGKVPKPKLAMINAPVFGSPLAKAQVRVE
jgi:hypothetical protein